MFASLVLVAFRFEKDVEHMASHPAHLSLFTIMIWYGLLAMAAFGWSVWVGYLVHGSDGLAVSDADIWLSHWITFTSLIGVFLFIILMMMRHSYMIIRLMTNPHGLLRPHHDAR